MIRKAIFFSLVGSMLVYLAISFQLLCGCLISIPKPVHSQSDLDPIVITRHSLPQRRLVLVNGSQPNGSCQDSTSTLDGYPISFCTGTSVLNDGIIPGLDGIGQSNQQWASGLFTLIGTNTIRLSFELDSVGHDRMELAVLNCPEMSINLRMLSVYFDSSFRPDRVKNNGTLGLGNLAVEAQIMNTSCDHLLVFCVKYNPTQLPTQFINLEIPNNSSGTFVFLGEVTFLNGGNKPCDLAMPEAVKDLPTATVTLASEHHNQQCDSCVATALTTCVVSVIITALLVAVTSAAVHITLYKYILKPRLILRGGRKLNPRSGGDDAVVYDDVNALERTVTTVMKANEAYGIANSRSTNKTT